MLVVPYYISVLKGLYMNNTPKRRCFLFRATKIEFVLAFTPPRFVNLY